MKVPNIPPESAIKTLGKTPTPIAVVKERKHATRDAGILILGSLACLALSIGAYIKRDSLKASERKAQDAVALIETQTPDAPIKEVTDAGVDAPMMFEDLSGKALKITKDAGADATKDVPMILEDLAGRAQVILPQNTTTLCDLATKCGHNTATAITRAVR